MRLLKADLETFFSATRPPAPAYQRPFLDPDADDFGGFTKTGAQSPLPRIFPCPPNQHCNPDGDPLLRNDGPCRKLTQQDLVAT